jgi:hypothetical protein
MCAYWVGDISRSIRNSTVLAVLEDISGELEIVRAYVAVVVVYFWVSVWGLWADRHTDQHGHGVRNFLILQESAHNSELGQMHYSTLVTLRFLSKCTVSGHFSENKNTIENTKTPIIMEKALA